MVASNGQSNLQAGKMETKDLSEPSRSPTDKTGNLPIDLGKKGAKTMGGFGSGNHWRWGTRNTVEDMKALIMRNARLCVECYNELVAIL